MDDEIKIDRRQLAGRPKRVGHWQGKGVVEVITKGGLHMIVHAVPGTPTLGTGPVRGVARHIARKNAPGIEFNDLHKADHVDVADYAHLLPRYEALTARFRALAE